MGNDAGSITDAGLAHSTLKGKVFNWKFFASLLVLTGFAGLGVYLMQNTSSQSGAPVLVLDLPKMAAPAKAPSDMGEDLSIRKSIDSHDQPIQKTRDGDDNLLPGGGVNISGSEKNVIPRAPDPPPGMTKVRIINPSKSTSYLDGAVREPLIRAPVKALQENSAFGAIPRVARDGRRSSDVYARPANLKIAPGQPVPARIAIVIGGLGISASSTHEAINKLPEEVTLAFTPYGQGLQNLVDNARRNGHEVMLQIPMEPFDYPDNDPGPRTLLSTVKPSENVKRLKWLMSRFSGYFGVTNYMGARFTSSEESLQPIMKWMGARGLVFLDDGASPRSRTLSLSPASGMSVKTAHTRLDDGQTPQSIKAALEKLEKLAAEQGLAIGVGTGMPLTIRFVTAWAKTLADRGIVLIPVSAVFRMQKQ